MKLNGALLALVLASQAVGAQDAPVCHCATQCAAMWARATSDVENASGMRLRLVSDTMLQTYVTDNASRQTGTVNKLPQSDGAYAIVLTLESSYRGQQDVQSTMASNTALFNKHLDEAGAKNQCR